MIFFPDLFKNMNLNYKKIKVILFSLNRFNGNNNYKK